MKKKIRFTAVGMTAGISLTVGSLGLAQDCLGLERWVAYERASWTTMPTWFWISAIILSVGMLAVSCVIERGADR